MRNEERAAKRMGEMEGVASEAVLELPAPEKKDFNFKSVFTTDGFKDGIKKIGMRNISMMTVIPETIGTTDKNSPVRSRGNSQYK